MINKIISFHSYEYAGDVGLYAGLVGLIKWMVRININ